MMLLWKLLALITFAGACKGVILPEIPKDFNVSDQELSAKADDIANLLYREYSEFLKTGVESPALKEMSAQMAELHTERGLITQDLPEATIEDQFFACVTCRATISVITDNFRNESSPAHNKPLFRKFVLGVCTKFNIYTLEICGAMFDSHYDMIMYIVMNTAMDSTTFCSLFMEWNFCNVEDPGYNWTIAVDSTGPAITGPKSNLPSKGSNDLRILHLTDIHHDPLYVPGSLAECREPLCCQRNKATSEGTSKAAGYWGDYRECDSPLHLVEDALRHIKETHKQIDYIYQTGDVIDHMVWSTSIEKNKEVLTTIHKKIEEHFPGVPLYGTVGNHEPHPLNGFSPPDVPEAFNTRWLYEHLYTLWSKWLPAEAKETMMKGGYYTASPKTGLRIITLNSIDCYDDNWWLYYKGTDKIPQLEWFHSTMLAAEKSDEYVHILTHIPSGDGGCWSVWSREYNRIIERFHRNIGGIFNGHSHKDEMNVHLSEKGHAIAMSWNGGSLTTYTFKNPNYRIYDVDPKTLQVLDHETWIFNLTAANEAGASKNPEWFKEYAFSHEFTSDLSPAGVNELLDKMADHPDILRKFWKYKMTSADPRVKDGCNRGCLQTTLCRIATTLHTEKKRCNELVAKLNIALDNEMETSSSVQPTLSTPTTKPTQDTSTKTTQETSTKTTQETPTTPEDDGAVAISAFRISSIIALVIAVKYVL